MGSLGSHSHPTNEQDQLVIGTILGDGYVYPNGRLQIEHKEQSYVLWKYEFLKNIISGAPKRCARFDKRTQKTYTSLRFYTKALFKSYRDIFYPEGKKIVPPNIDQLILSPLSLAVWFMDDGGRGARTPKGLIISLAGYIPSDRIVLQRCLWKNFGLVVNLHNNGQMYIPAKYYKKFYHLVAPYVLPLMKYKIPITL